MPDPDSLTLTACPFSTLGLVVVSSLSVPLISSSLSNAHFPKKKNHCFMHLSCLIEGESGSVVAS